MPLLFHGYSSSPQMADDLLAHYNAYFSFSTREMTRKKSVEVMKHIPITRLLIETDDSEESSVRQLYAKVAEILNIQEEELKRVCWENFETFIIKSTQKNSSNFAPDYYPFLRAIGSKSGLWVEMVHTVIRHKPLERCKLAEM